MAAYNRENQKLVNFETYEDYLDSFLTPKDLEYLPNLKSARMIVELGYRSVIETLSKEEFIRRKTEALEQLYPSRKPYYLFGSDVETISTDPFLIALTERERSNRDGVLSTIINLRVHTKSGIELSGYIDFEESLRRAYYKSDGFANWKAIFNETMKLLPRLTDLGFFNWKNGYSIVNKTRNYKPLQEPGKGLIFMNRHDRCQIVMDPKIDPPGRNTTRTRIDSPRYDQIVLFDHILRAKN